MMNDIMHPSGESDSWSFRQEDIIDAIFATGIIILSLIVFACVFLVHFLVLTSLAIPIF